MSLPAIYYVQAVSSYLVFLVGLLLYRRLSAPFRLLTILFGAYAIAEGLLYLANYREFAGHPVITLWVSHVLTVLEISILIRVFQYLNPSDAFRRISHIVLWTALFALGVLKLTIEPLSVYDSYAQLISTLLVVSMALYTYLGEQRNSREITALRDYKFWFVSATLILYGAALFFSLSYNQIGDEALLKLLYYLRWTCTILGNIFYMLALITSTPRKRRIHPVESQLEKV